MRSREYYDSVRIYSPLDCVDIFGKIIALADDILLGDNKTAIAQFRSIFGPYSIGINGSVADFAYWNLNFPYSTQSKTWIPCLMKFDNVRNNHG